MSKFAVVVGINAYGGVGDLVGCTKDADTWKTMLLSSGFDPSNIRILIDEEAAKAEIIRSLQWLVSGRDPAELLVFTFSGHGSWTLPPNGRGWECCICCCNCAQGWDGGVLTNSEYFDILTRWPVRLFSSLDCCCAGGMGKPSQPLPRLPPHVREFLYGSDPSVGRKPGIRVLPGPEWETIDAARSRLGLSQREMAAQIRKREFVVRRLHPGPTHVLTKDKD